MLKAITHCSKQMAMTIIPSNINSRINHAIISISEPVIKDGYIVNLLTDYESMKEQIKSEHNLYYYYPYTFLNSKWDHVLRLYFDDVEEDDIKCDNDMTCNDKCNRYNDKLKPFDKTDAIEILYFLDKLDQLDKEVQLYVHCAAGVSRSVAVARFVSNYYEIPSYSFSGDGSTSLNKSKNKGNEYVYNMLEKVNCEVDFN